MTLPRVAAAQYRVGTHIPLADARPGDLVFFGYGGNPATIFHVGIYVGNAMMVEAPYTGLRVRVISINQPGLLPLATRPA